ncbi:flagellar biosynthetic protein FliO [Burkholderia sp. PU8-34]
MNQSSSSWLTPASSVVAARYPDIDWGHVATATLFCIGLSIVAILMLRKRLSRGSTSGSTSTPRIRVVEHARLAPRATLHLVEYDQRVVMLVTDAAGVRVLDAHDRHDPDR